MGTVTYARHIYARAMASFEHCMMDSSVISFIVHLLLCKQIRIRFHALMATYVAIVTMSNPTIYTVAFTFQYN